MPTVGLLITSFRPEADIRQHRLVDVLRQPDVTLENYDDGPQRPSTSLATFFVNSFVITIPAVIIPIILALLAAYAFAWIDFKGRDILFVAVFALQVVPIQVTLIPLLTTYVKLGPGRARSGRCGSRTRSSRLPLAIFLLHNFMKEIPASLIEAARVDGAGHVQIFFQVLMPLLVPAIASFAIFQFLWVWNDLLVAPDLRGGTANVAPMTVRVAELAGTPRHRVAPAVGGCVHRDDRAAGRVPQPAALLRPRPAGRCRQGLIPVGSS